MSFLRNTRSDALSIAATVRWWGDDADKGPLPYSSELIVPTGEEKSPMGRGRGVDAPVVDPDEIPPPHSAVDDVVCIRLQNTLLVDAVANGRVYPEW